MARKMNDPELEAQKQRITALAVEVQEAIAAGEAARQQKLELFKLVQPCALSLELSDRYNVFLKTLDMFDGNRNDNFFAFFASYANYRKINAQYYDVMVAGDKLTRRAILNDNYDNIVNN